jgi:hypothetical protein
LCGNLTEGNQLEGQSVGGVKLLKRTLIKEAGMVQIGFARTRVKSRRGMM